VPDQAVNGHYSHMPHSIVVCDSVVFEIWLNFEKLITDCMAVTMSNMLFNVVLLCSESNVSGFVTVAVSDVIQRD